MKKSFKIAALFLLAFVPATMTGTPVLDDSVQVRNVFANMPDSVLELIPRNTRLDCLDFFDSQMESTVRNRMGGLVQITGLSSSCLQLQCDGTECIGFKLLPCPGKSNYLICVVTTLKGRSDFSTIKIFNKDWVEMPVQNYVQMPLLKSFVNSRYAKKDSIALLEQKLPFISYGIELDMSACSMQVSLTSQNQFSLEDSTYFSKWFAKDPAVNLKWNGRCFK